MGRDARISRRNALLIPGWLLIVYSLAAITYAEGIRARSDFCADGGYVLINGLCYTVWKLVLPLLLIGIGLAIGGALGFKGAPERLEQRLHHGSPTHVLLAVLISFLVVPILALGVQFYRQSANGITYQVELLGVAFEHVFLLEVAILIAALILLPFAIALVGDMRRRQDFLDAAAQPQEQILQERGSDDGHREPDEAFEEDETEDWPDSRSEENTNEDDSQPLLLDEDADQDTFLAYHLAPMPVVELEGIGDAYAKRLNDAGIETTLRLLAEEPAALAERTGIASGHIESWQKMAEFTAVKGIGPQYAEALVRAGISGVAELKRRSAATLAKQVTDYLAGLDNHVLGTAITEARIKGWQEAAKGMRKARQLIPDA